MKAVITGGGGVLGRELKKKLHGYEVYLLDKVKVKDVIQVDVTDEASLVDVFKKIGPIDLLINCAGIMRRGDLFDTSEDYDLMFDVNVKASWLSVKNADLNKDAVVVFVSSRHGFYLKSDPGLYSLTKKAQASLAEILRETISQKVKIAYPGPFESPVSLENVSSEKLAVKKKFMRKPDEIAGLIVDLVNSDKQDLFFNEEKNVYEFL